MGMNGAEPESAMLSIDPPFTVDSLAERWSCSPGAVRNRIKAGELQAFRVGNLIRIAVAEVMRFEEPRPWHAHR